MATVTHSTLTGAELHEPKGIDAAAAASQLYKGTSGTSVWSITPFAQVTDSAITQTNTTSYEIMSKTGSTFEFGQSLISEATGFGLKYLGTNSRKFLVRWSGSVKQDQAGTKQVFVCPAYNGTVKLDYEVTAHCVQNEYVPIGGAFFYTFSLNGYMELFAYDADATHVITILNPIMVLEAVGPESA